MFLWFTCGCRDTDELTAARTEGGFRAYGHEWGPVGAAGPEPRTLPEERALVLEPARAPYEVSRAVQGFAQHQVGGLPGWTLGPEPHPRCPECASSMPYLATLAGGVTPFGAMPFRGNVYCFWCAGCRVGTATLQERDA
ncbi:hypothetical protein [Streptomyces sp. HNM0574]|uniref:hypothetical protein n=1 Tax=Streptomyces sp. HNM0574 TaxID=2714954 RepID=UPI00146D86E9|nr:hypothetical protein [Streptomyces sp. HNM0574]NLU70378.1 hypothetical protein [Streptomyces sp. HNM0574]